jgi:hypothetical protein
MRSCKGQEANEEKVALKLDISQLHQVSNVDSVGLTSLHKQTEQLQLTACQETERVCELLHRRKTLHREAEKKIEELKLSLGY